MAKRSNKGGRPKRADETGGTTMIRVNADLAEMIAWVARLENTTAAQLVDPLVRAPVTAKYAKHTAAIEKIKKAEENVRKIEDAARQGYGEQ